MSQDEGQEWDDLLEAEDNARKVSTQVGVQHFQGEASGEFIALKSHDLYDAFTGRELTDLAHKPFSEVEVVPEDVEGFFDDLLDDMLELRREDSHPGLEAVADVAHTRRQVLLWMLSMESLQGAHIVTLPPKSRPMEVLVVDGRMGALVSCGGELWLDAQIREEQPELCARLDARLELHNQGPHPCVPASLISPAESQALMALLMRSCELSASVPSETLRGIDTRAVEINDEDWAVFDMLDFFIMDAAEPALRRGLSERCFKALDEAPEAQGWLLRQREPLHPFDSVIAHSDGTPHSLHLASHATLFGNATRQLISALGFDTHHTCLCALADACFALSTTDAHTMSLHIQPLKHCAGTLGQALNMITLYPAEPSVANAQIPAIEQDERLHMLRRDMPMCEVVALCDVRAQQLDWRVSLGERPGQQAHRVAHRKQSARAVRAAIEQFQVIGIQQSEIKEFFIFTNAHIALVLQSSAMPGVRAIWLCKFVDNLGTIRAQARKNLAAFSAL